MTLRQGDKVRVDQGPGMRPYLKQFGDLVGEVVIEGHGGRLMVRFPKLRRTRDGAVRGESWVWGRPTEFERVAP